MVDVFKPSRLICAPDHMKNGFDGIEYSSVMKSSSRYIIVALMGLMALFYSTPANASTDGEGRAQPQSTLISSKVTPGQGTVAWSPGGGRLAYLEKRLVIMDMDSGKRIKSPVKGIYNLRWLDDSRLLALRRQRKKTLASLIGGSGELVREVVLPKKADAAYPIKGFERLLLLGSRAETLRIGVNTTASAGVFNTADGSYGEVFNAGRIQPRSLIGLDFIMGWAEAGPSPLDDGLVLIDYKDPPALNPYTRVIVVDYSIGEGNAVYRMPLKMLGPGGSWSPGGDTLAIADSTGTLMIIGRGGEILAPEIKIKGSHAAWSPVADRICFGGYVLSPEGGNIVKLREGAQRARCLWRPGGRDLALLTDKKLEIFTSADEPDMDKGRAEKAADKLLKVRLLKDLLGEGLVDRKDYDMRLQRLTGIEIVEVSR
jgi:hypothetical protein